MSWSLSGAMVEGGQEVQNKRQMSKEQQYADDTGEVGQALGNTPLWEQLCD